MGKLLLSAALAALAGCHIFLPLGAGSGERDGPGVDLLAAEAGPPCTVSPTPPSGSLVCSSDGVCWLNPLPQGNDLRAVSAVGAITVVGAAGTVLERASTWSGATHAAWGQINDVWDGFAVGARGTILHRGPAGDWQRQDYPELAQCELTSVWGLSASDVWAVGVCDLDGGGVPLLAHHTSGKWLEEKTALATHLTQPRAVWGAGTTLYVVGQNVADNTARVVTIDTSDLSMSSVSLAGVAELRGIWGNAAGEIWAVGQTALLRFDAKSGTWLDDHPGLERPLNDVWGVEADVWAVGENGTVLRRDPAGAWSGGKQASVHLYGVGGRSATEVYAVGQRGELLRFDGTDWRSERQGSASHVYGVWGASACDLHLVGDKQRLRFDGVTLPLPVTTLNYELHALWGRSAGDIWAVGQQGRVEHFDGASWTVEPEPAALTTDGLNDAWGTADGSALWVVGGTSVSGKNVSGVFLRRANGKWHKDDSTLEMMTSVWGFGGSDVYAVGHDLWSRFDGSGWSHTSASAFGINAMWGSSSASLSAVGNTCLFKSWNGASWEPGAPAPCFGASGAGLPSAPLYGLHGRTGELYVAGSGGRLWRLAKGAWTALDSGTDSTLREVFLVDGQLFAVGVGGTVLHMKLP